MKFLLGRGYASEFFTKRMNANKGKGILAQSDFANYLSVDVRKIHRPGCWVVSPNIKNSYRFRVAIFTGSKVLGSKEIDQETDKIERDYAFQRVGHFLRDAGLLTLVALPWKNVQNRIKCDKDLGEMQWSIYRMSSGKLILTDDIFREWPKRGRATIKQREWDPNTLTRLKQLSQIDLDSLFLNESFYCDYFKKRLKVSTRDPYDVDGFLVPYDGTVLPLEMKEKFPGEGKEKYFGLDAGRILMLLRLCLPTDSNALFLVKEVEDSDKRKLVGWKAVTLAEIVSSAGWNLTGGGRGMTGGPTQTVRIPYDVFSDFDSITLSSLSEIEPMPIQAKSRAQEFLRVLESWLEPRQMVLGADGSE